MFKKVKIIYLICLLIFGIGSLAASGTNSGTNMEGPKHSALSFDKAAPVMADRIRKDRDSIDEAARARIDESYGKLPLSFIRNDGQMDSKVEYYERGSGHSTYFTKEGVYLELFNSRGDTDTLQGAEDDKSVNGSSGPDDDPEANNSLLMHGQMNLSMPPTESEVIKLVPLGGNKNPKVSAENVQMGKVNYFVGNDPEKWQKDIPTYKAVLYEGVYDGIDMKFYGNNRQMEYDVIVKPGADPSLVQLSYEGIEGLCVTEEGNLEIALKEGSVIHKKPYCYQEIDGKRVEVAGNFKIINLPHETGVSNPKSEIQNPQFIYGFQVASYNKKHPLIIDPVLEYSTYLGGSVDDQGHGIAVDASGNAYIMGYTNSTDFPTLNPYQIPSYQTSIFITKLDPTGNTLSYSTALGGNTTYSVGRSIAVDDLGNVYVVGTTSATDFPTQNPYQSNYAGGSSDVFVTKLDPSGSQLVYSTYLGGGDREYGNGIAVDASGNAYVTGYTYTDFPTLNPYQDTVASTTTVRADAFVSKFDTNGMLSYSTYLGGGGHDIGWDIAVDSSGNAYVTGETHSTDFPTLNPYQSSHAGGSCDAFITKLNPSGNSLSYSTYLGGGDKDYGRRIAVDASRNTFVTGYTYSTDFPTLNPYQSGHAGGMMDVFVTKLNPAGNTLSYSTYLGGSSSFEVSNGIAVDSSGCLFITGHTRSTDFPTQYPFQSYLAGYEDAFITKFDPSGSTLSYSTYLGGENGERAEGIAVDGSGNAYVTGNTRSSDFPTQNPYKANLTGVNDVFITKLSGGAINTPPIADAGTDQSVYVNDTVTLDGSNSYDSDGDLLTYSWTFTSIPLGSLATLLNPDAVNPTFTVDVFGTYVVSLTVNDGTVDSAPSSVTITTLNSAPVADAGIDNSVYVTDTVTLDGSGSSDVDGDMLTYSWSFTSTPIGSIATILNETEVYASFVADIPGDYVVQLIVNDGTVNSDPDTVTISTLNSKPIADAGGDQAEFVGNTVTLDGSNSWDLDGDNLTYRWAFTSIPASSTATLSDQYSVGPTFFVDKPGDYVLSLIVNDGTVDSDPDMVIISTITVAPVADAGNNQSVVVTDIVFLDGSSSYDPDGDSLTYSWSFTSIPTGSASTLSDATVPDPTFTPDMAGTYVVSLTVNDGTVNSAPDSVSIAVVTQETQAIIEAQEAIDIINAVDPGLFKNPNNAKALTNQIIAMIGMIDNGDYANALSKTNSILKKTDGCANGGAPDKNDWIEDCDTQDLVYSGLQDVILYLEELIP